MRRRAFTLIELLVVLAMIAILVGAMSTSVAAARRRAKIAKATQEMKDLTNAILASEQYAKGRSLENYVTGGWKTCDETSLLMVLNTTTGESGERTPVLFSASLVNGQVLDPWGKPYEFIIEKMSSLGSNDDTQYQTGPQLPNFFRLSLGERAIPKREGN